MYKLFTPEEISEKIADIVRPEDMKADLQIVFQTIENLHKAIPMHKGDWYFTGKLPHPGRHEGGQSIVPELYGRKVGARLLKGMVDVPGSILLLRKLTDSIYPLPEKDWILFASAWKPCKAIARK